MNVQEIRPNGCDAAHPGHLQFAAAARHTAAAAQAPNYLYLTGQPTMKQFLRYVDKHAVAPPSEGTLVDEWHAARDVLREIEKNEAGLADDPPLVKLGKEYEPLLTQFLLDPLVRESFNTVPTQVAMVELDRLVVYQKHIDVTHAGQLETRLGPTPGMADIFHTCLPFDHPQPPVSWSRTTDGFTFVSPSRDMRFLGALRLEPRNIKDYPPPGDIVGVAGLAVGFGTNFLNAIYCENRLILNNGSHRAYALRKMGIRNVPCIVQHVPSREALEVVASRDVRSDPDHFLKSPRPPMLKDYFHPGLHKVMVVHRRLKQVTVRFEVEETDVPAL